MNDLIARETRTAKCRARLAGRAPDAKFWNHAARCLRLVRAESSAVNAFLPLSPLCQCAGSAAVVVYFCVSWGGKALHYDGKKLIEYLCAQIPGLNRVAFDAAESAFCAITGADVRAFGPSVYEYLLALSPRLTKRYRVWAARECLIRAQEPADPRGPLILASEIIQATASSVGLAGNLVGQLAV